MNFVKIKKELIVWRANSRDRMRISYKKIPGGKKSYFCIHGNFVLGRNRDISKPDSTPGLSKEARHKQRRRSAVDK
jgi:hypothetical protein